MASGNIVRSGKNFFRDHLPPTFTAMAERATPVRRPVKNLFGDAILILSHPGKCEKGIVANFLTFDNTRRFGDGAAGAAETGWGESRQLEPASEVRRWGYGAVELMPRISC